MPNNPVLVYMDIAVYRISKGDKYGSEYSCLKCQAKTQAGYVLDQTYGGYVAPAWREGPVPEKGFLGGIKLVGTPFPVTTFRCTRCGFLEVYADPPILA